MNAHSLALATQDSNGICCETLERLGELHADRIHNPKYVRPTVWVYAPSIASLGVLGGFALYFKIEPIVNGVGPLRRRNDTIGAVEWGAKWRYRMTDAGNDLWFQCTIRAG
jgi:hypothetical protein